MGTGDHQPSLSANFVNENYDEKDLIDVKFIIISMNQ